MKEQRKDDGSHLSNKVFSSNSTKDDAIDLTQVKEKILNLFKNKAWAKEKAVSDDSIDLKKISIVLKSNARWLIPVLFILIAIFTSTYLRMTTDRLPVAEDWAESSIKNFYKQQVRTQVNQQYPNLPEKNRNILINQEVEKLLKENSEQVERDKAAIAQQFRSEFQDEKGDTYLLEIDTYLWYSEARNILRHGHLGDKIIDGESYFTLRDGRLDKKSSVQLNPYLAVYLYKFLKVFNSNITLARALFLLPVVLVGLTIIPTFLIGRRLAGNIAGFFAAMFLAVNGALLARTVGGFADTDSFQVLFPVAIVWFILEAILTKNNKLKVLYSLLAGLFVGAYSASWSGWSFIFLIVIAVIISVMIFRAVTEYRNSTKLKDSFSGTVLKKQLIILLTFIIFSGIFVTWFQDFDVFWDGFSRPISFISLKEVGVKSIWPNVLTTVAEFNTVSFSNIISEAGGNLLFWGGLIGVILLLIPRKRLTKYNVGYLIFSGIYYAFFLMFKDKLNNPVTFLIVVSIPIILGVLKLVWLKEKINLFYPFLLTLWLLSTAYAFSKGVRFALLMVPAFSLALGTTLSYLFNYVGSWLGGAININKKLSKSVIFVILALLLIQPFSSASNIAKHELPSIDDAWYESLIKIKNDSDDAIITSWWDFGHWFQAIAERRVTFDGGDQGERIHWVGKALITDDEQEAIGILRMLNCVQEKAPHQLDEYTGNTLKSINILYEIFPISDRSKALQKYQELGLTTEQANVMIEHTHCQDLIKNYFITSQDMVGKAGVWGHFGSWDFKKAVMYHNTKKLSRSDATGYLMENFNLTEVEAGNLYNEIQDKDADKWISPWPGYLTSPHGCETKENKALVCTVNLQGDQFTIEVENTDVKIVGTDIKPNSLVFATLTEIKEHKFEGKTAGFSVILIPDGDGYAFVLADPSQAAGIFTRLFYLEAHGLKCFQKFDDVNSPTNQRIITWKIDFDCKQNNEVFFKDSTTK